MSKVHKVAILGAGLGGLGMAMRLLHNNEQSFVILEKSDRVGGTWRDNTYPGCGCDVPSHMYWYSFDQQPDWSRAFALQPEILSHIDDMTERAGLRQYIRFGKQVSSARWEEATRLWHIRTADGEEIVAEAFVTAAGQLGQPSFRGIDGYRDFKGPWFHTARWQHDVALAGKRVAVIGSGASAAQVIPELAKVVAQLTVFQRSAPYVIARGDRAYSDDERRQLRDNPALMVASRAAIFQDLEMRFETLKPGSEGALFAERLCREQREAQVPDPELRRKLTPDYTLGCKRPVISDDYLPTFSRANVSLVCDPITQVTAEGVRTADSHLHEVDVIVYATGFASLRFLDGLEVTGRSGKSLHQDAWRDAAEAYLGMTVAGFPNFFILYGPNTNLNHNSIIAMLEAQYEYVLQALQLASKEKVAIDLRPEVQVHFNRELQAAMQQGAFVTGCNSWYVNGEGRVVTNWWGDVAAYHARAARLDAADYDQIK
jgi:cation diffusion facilitator CzcD-associated flavoprotein CzcO